MDKRLIFRYRSRTIQSQVCAGCAKPSAALELLRLTAQVSDLLVRAEAGESPQGQFDLRLPPRKAHVGMPRAPVPQTDTGGRA